MLRGKLSGSEDVTEPLYFHTKLGFFHGKYWKYVLFNYMYEIFSLLHQIRTTVKPFRGLENKIGNLQKISFKKHLEKPQSYSLKNKLTTNIGFDANWQITSADLSMNIGVDKQLGWIKIKMCIFSIYNEI